MIGHHQATGKHNSNRLGKNGKWERGYCICIQCGYSVNHEAGLPCKTIVCPNCKIILVRSETPGKETIANLTSLQDLKPEIQERNIQFPKVVPEKCTACGACIDICPRSTIVMRNSKAFIEIGNCRNCQACMKACPVDAIILE
jgi:Pyruvate/2-oxoacid:ferredoxin oxidoreductase delta subunit